MNWANAYVGLPFADQGRDHTGCDCWGLVRLVYEDQLNIHLLSYASDYTGCQERAEVAALIDREIGAGAWIQTATPQMFDVLLFRRGRFGSHVGIRLNANKMLHMAQGEQAKVEDVRAAKWSKRALGAYRHRARVLPLNTQLKVCL